MRFWLSVIGGFAFLLFPLAAYAMLVPCAGGSACQACHLVSLFNNVLQFAVILSSAVATVMFAYAGFLYVTASANQNNISKAHGIFGKVLLGFLFVLAAWLIVNVIMNVFINTSTFRLPWNEIQCVEAPSVTPPTGQPPVTTPPVTGPPGGLSQAQAQALLIANGIGVSSSGNCADASNPTCTSLDGIQLSTVNDLVSTQNDLGYDLTVTAGTEVGHQNPCHQAGTCVDVVPTDRSIIGSAGNFNVDNINEFIETSQSNGRCAVFEPGAGVACPPGVTSCQSFGTAPHFSFYRCSP